MVITTVVTEITAWARWVVEYPVHYADVWQPVDDGPQLRAIADNGDVCLRPFDTQARLFMDLLGMPDNTTRVSLAYTLEPDVFMKVAQITEESYIMAVGKVRQFIPMDD